MAYELEDLKKQLAAEAIKFPPYTIINQGPPYGYGGGGPLGDGLVGGNEDALYVGSTKPKITGPTAIAVTEPVLEERIATHEESHNTGMLPPQEKFYRLVPKQDITVFELASILAISGLSITEEDFDCLSYSANRHFKCD